MHDTSSRPLGSPPEARDTALEVRPEPATDVEAIPAIARLVTAVALFDDRFKHVSIVHPGLDPTAPVVATSLLAATMAGAQLATDQGAVWAAMRTGLPELLTTADLATRFPRMHLVAGSLGVRLQLALPLADGTRAVGALVVYLTDATEVHPSVRELAQAVALQASVGLAQEQRIVRLEAAMESRQDVAKACGILMARFRLTDDAAFAALRQASQKRNAKARDLAAEVIATGTLPELEGNR